MGASDNKNGAFLPEHIVIEGAAAGPLNGLTFAAKDLYDVRPNALAVASCWAATSSCLPRQGMQVMVCCTAGQGISHGVRQPRMDSNACARHIHSPCSPGMLYRGSRGGRRCDKAHESALLALVRITRPQTPAHTHGATAPQNSFSACRSASLFADCLLKIKFA